MARSGIVNMLWGNGDVRSAHGAEANLPEMVDTGADHDALAHCGIDIDYPTEREQVPW